MDLGKFNKSNANMPPGEGLIVFDIETVSNKIPGLIEIAEQGINPRLVKPEIIEKHKAEAIEKMGLWALTGKVIMCGFLTNAKYTLPKSIGELSTNSLFFPLETTNYIYYQPRLTERMDEKALLEHIWKIFEAFNNEGFTFGSYNGKGFDLPYLIQRSTFLDIKPELMSLSIPNLLYPYSNKEHSDLFLMLGKEGKLAEYAYGTGLTDSLESDNLIGEWYEQNNWAKISSKNLGDIFATMVLLERIKRFI